MKICLLLNVVLALALACPLPPQSGSCNNSSSARHLLCTLTDIMDKQGKLVTQGLFAGFNCTDLEAQMIPYTNTASACLPAVSETNMSCSSRRNTSFKMTECLRNIRADLDYYGKLLNSYTPKEADLSRVIEATEELKKDVETKYNLIDSPLSEWRVWGDSSFDNRLSLCKTLKGFHVRTITINRALSYIASGDHRK